MADKQVVEVTPAEQAVAVAKVYEDEVNVKTAMTILDIKSDMHIKSLAREGKIPTAVKNSQGYWKFSEAALRSFAATRVKGGHSGGGGAKDGKRSFKIRLSAEQQAVVAGALEGTGIELLPLNKPATPEQKARQKARDAARKAAHLAEAKAKAAK